MSPSVESMLVRSQCESHPRACLNGVVRARSCVAVAVSVAIDVVSDEGRLVSAVSLLEDMMEGDGTRSGFGSWVTL